MIEQIINDENQVILVIRDAGTGKTTLITGKESLGIIGLAPSLASTRGKSTSYPLVLAFNVEARKELIARLGSDYDKSVKTTYSIGLSLLHANSEHKIEVDNEKLWKYIVRDVVTEFIYDENSQVSSVDKNDVAKALIMATNLMRVNLNDTTDEQIKSLINNYQLTELDAGNQSHVVAVRTMIERSNALYEEKGIVDITDMVYLPCIYHYETQYKRSNVIVDEAQDLSYAQLCIVQKFWNGRGKLIFVGDPKQSIYYFAGSTGRTFDIIKAMFGGGVSEYRLNKTYRCAKKITEYAEKLYVQGYETASETEGVVDYIDAHKFYDMVKNGDMVLGRKNSTIVTFYYELLRRGKNVVVTAAVIQAALEPIRLIDKNINGYVDIINALKEKRDEKLLKAQKYTDEMSRDLAIMDINDKFGTAITLVNYMANGDTSSYNKKYITPSDIVYRAEVASINKSDAINLSTIHSAKGQEAKRVFLLDKDDMPLRATNKIAALQEINLLYISATRAIEEYYMVSGAPTLARETDAVKMKQVEIVRNGGNDKLYTQRDYRPEYVKEHEQYW